VTSSYPVNLISKKVLGEAKPVYEIALIEKDDKDQKSTPDQKFLNTVRSAN